MKAKHLAYGAIRGILYFVTWVPVYEFVTRGETLPMPFLSWKIGITFFGFLALWVSFSLFADRLDEAAAPGPHPAFVAAHFFRGTTKAPRSLFEFDWHIGDDYKTARIWRFRLISASGVFRGQSSLQWRIGGVWPDVWQTLLPLSRSLPGREWFYRRGFDTGQKENLSGRIREINTEIGVRNVRF